MPRRSNFGKAKVSEKLGERKAFGSFFLLLIEFLYMICPKA